MTGVGRVALAGAVALVSAGWMAATAAAATDLKLREVHDGGPGGGDYVELQMYSAGQETVAGSYVVTYDNAGNQLTPAYQLPGNVPNGQSQSTVLISDGGAGVAAPDFVAPELEVPAPAGSACWYDLSSGGKDCVAWGSTAPPSNNPSPVGLPVLFFGGGLPSGGTIRRTIAPNCPTLLEAFDDSNDSATDFAVATPDPRSNASPPIEAACPGAGPPDTEITEGPKPQTHGKKTTFEFTSTTPNSSFECNLDGTGFLPCTSPHKVRVKKGKHAFQVRATDPIGQVDPVPAQADWKVKPKRHKP